MEDNKTPSFGAFTGLSYKTIGNCDVEIPRPFCLVVFGATGDLAKRKLLPSLYRLAKTGLLPENFFVLGVARSGMEKSVFRGAIRDAVQSALGSEFDFQSWSDFSHRLYYVKADYAGIESFRSVRRRIGDLEKRHATTGNRIYYLAVPPDIYEPVALNLGAAGLSREEKGYAHIVVEKPIGSDLESAKRLNEVLRDSFEESQVYRMDHYLAKETVQNILMFRFANSIFEPLWNRRYIDHVQITVSETLGVGHRAGYYDRAGVIRDMFQNHLFQLLALTAMEAPTAFEAETVRDEKMKVFRSFRPFPLERAEDVVVLGQYGEGMIGEEKVFGYREEEGIPRDSVTPTYAAMKVHIDNWRWNGVPFYLRSGKRLATRKAEIAVHFRPVPHLMFAHTLEGRIEPNTLIMKVQPEEGISLVFQAKTQGTRVCLGTEMMDFSYKKISALGDYERILLDCMQGDQMLFVRGDGVEQTWRLLSPLLERLESADQIKSFPNYAAGSSGPRLADAMMEKDGRAWGLL
jgi:glucose-6-phosphate 1-dehydrogenase